jgi:selenocysteine-specific elongation factor
LPAAKAPDTVNSVRNRPEAALVSTSAKRNLILATAGHVDHGKSSLVKALTGTDPDRLPEEKARGITIDLGFAHLELTSAEGVVLDVGIVDVPGHEDFVKNMVAGVGSVDAALFVVAADDGWMPQSEEHLQILSYLGVHRGVVALTKADLAPSHLESVIASVRKELQDTGFAQAPIVPTSVLSGLGVDELRKALTQVLVTVPPPRSIGKPRLAVDRAFTLRGIGAIVTGTLTGGAFHRNEPVVIEPGTIPTRIRSIQSHSRDFEKVEPSTRTALNLADVTIEAPAGGAKAATVYRGQTITLPTLSGATETVDVLLEKSARLAGKNQPAAKPLKAGTRVRVHQGTANVSGRVLFLDRKELAPGERGLGQLRLDSPLLLFTGDRFLVRDWSEQATLAGGRVLDSEAKRRNWANPAQRQLLASRAEDPASLKRAVETQLERDRFVACATLLMKSHWSAAEIAAAIDELRRERKLVLAGKHVAQTQAWNAARQSIIDQVDAHHRAHPEQLGLALDRLRATVDPSLREVFDLILAELCQGTLVQAGALVRTAQHRPELPPALRASGSKLRSVLAARPLDPPSRKELASDPISQQVLRFLIQTGEVAEVGPEIVLLTETLAKSIQLIRSYLATHGQATVSDLRQAVGASRRIVVPLLEKLDRDGITRRVGDMRVLR